MQGSLGEACALRCQHLVVRELRLLVDLDCVPPWLVGRVVPLRARKERLSFQILHLLLDLLSLRKIDVILDLSRGVAPDTLVLWLAAVVPQGWRQ